MFESGSRIPDRVVIVTAANDGTKRTPDAYGGYSEGYHDGPRVNIHMLVHVKGEQQGGSTFLLSTSPCFLRLVYGNNLLPPSASINREIHFTPRDACLASSSIIECYGCVGFKSLAF